MRPRFHRMTVREKASLLRIHPDLSHFEWVIEFPNGECIFCVNLASCWQFLDDQTEAQLGFINLAAYESKYIQ